MGVEAAVSPARRGETIAGQPSEKRFHRWQNLREGSQKVMEGTGKYKDDPGCLRKSGRFYNRCIHIAYRGKEFFLKANSDLVKEVDF
jgi:hypothetical protein